MDRESIEVDCGSIEVDCGTVGMVDGSIAMEHEESGRRDGRTRRDSPGAMRPHTSIWREVTMETRQRQVMEAFTRVRLFTDEHPVTGALTYASARDMLDDVLQRMRALATAQLRGRELSRAERRRQQDQVSALLDGYIRPIVTIARAQIAPGSDVGLPAALRMPKLPIRPTALLEFCDHMIAAAREHEAVFVANGLPADFLEQFAAAREALVRVTAERVSQVGAHVAARAALRVQLTRGRRAVERLDAIVRASFRADPATLDAWRIAKRVQALPGGAPASAAAGDPPTLKAA